MTKNYPNWAFDADKFKQPINGISIPKPSDLTSVEAMLAYWKLNNHCAIVQSQYAILRFQTHIRRNNPLPPDNYQNLIDQFEKDFYDFIEKHVIYCLTYM